MIILDTNVISELFKPMPDAGVAAWLKKQPDSSLFTTTITRGELFFGVQLMPDGRRKDDLTRSLNRLFDLRLKGRVLSYDDDAADAYARIAAKRRASGKRDSKPFDTMIAGIARSRGAELATRNVGDFTDCDIVVIDPWQV